MLNINIRLKLLTFQLCLSRIETSSRKRVNAMKLNLLFLFGISLLLVSNVVPQIIPPRFDKIIDDLSKWRHVDPQLLVRQQILPTYSPETMLKSMLMTSSHNDFDQCLSDVSTIVSGVAEKQMWAIKTIDAWGKPLPAGVLKGNTFWTGNYDECINLFYQVANKSYLPQPISTQYCTFINITKSLYKMIVYPRIRCISAKTNSNGCTSTTNITYTWSLCSIIM